MAHAGAFPALEDRMVRFTPFGIEGDGAAGRVDAMVWALSGLFPRMVKPQSKADWNDRHGSSKASWPAG